MYLIVEKIQNMSLQNEYYQKEVRNGDLETHVPVPVLPRRALLFWASHLIPLSINFLFKWSINCLNIGGEQLRLFGSEY